MCRVLISTVFVAAIALTVIAPAMSIETGNRDTAQKETSNSTAQHRLVALEQKLVALTERIEQLEHALKQSHLDNDPKEVQFKIFSLVYADAESTTKTVSGLFPKTKGKSLCVTFDKRTNAILARGPDGDLAILEALLLRLDRAKESNDDK